MDAFELLAQRIMRGRPFTVPDEYVPRLPMQEQNPPFTPHPMDTLNKIMRDDVKRHGELTLDADEEANRLLMQEMLRDVLSDHMYSDDWIGNVTGPEIPAILGRTYPIADPLASFLESLGQDVPQY